jgi:hypothetical protein
LRRILIYTHRWLGICGCVLFVMWFASGIVMMYMRMPELAATERIERSEPLDLSTVRVSIADAAGPNVDRVRIHMLAGRPVYRIAPRGAGGYRVVYADSGEVLAPITRDQALDFARRFAPEHAATLRYASFLAEPDQWTLSGEARRGMPLHRVSLGDPARTDLYISQQNGDVVMKTDAGGRRWAYVGAIPHWIYFTPLRRRAPVWTQTIIWLSLAGCALCLSGLVWGVWRVSIHSRYRLKRQYSHSPYAGLMRWHHYAGLVFGVAAFTWIFSGLLSMDPWDWHPPTAPTRQQRDGVAGGSLRLDDVTVARVETAVAQVLSRRGDVDEASAGRGEGRAGGPLKELDIVQFRGERFLAAGSRLVSLDVPERGAFEMFADDAMLASGRAAMPGVSVRDAVWLKEYDAYYYDRMHTLRLPVLRVRYDDPPGTWLYLDPSRGSIALREERLSRINRWLYHGLHSLDFPVLYNRRPFWDLVVIALSVGGLLVSATPFVAAGRRLRRRWRRLKAIW